MTQPNSETVRTALIDALQADLIGPFDADSGQEVLPLAPSRWYLTGFLAPQNGNELDPDDDAADDLATASDSQAEDSGSTDPEPKRRQHFPASMGLSVFLPPPTDEQTDHIDVEVRYADYVKEEIAEDHDQHVKTGWRRVAHGPHRLQVPLERNVLESKQGVLVAEKSGLRLRGELRETNLEGLPIGARVLSLFLVNQRTPLDQDRDLNYIFQARLTLHYPQGFLPRPNRQGEDANDDDQRVLALQFRNHCEWAVGHNTSLAMPTSNAAGQVTELTTTQLPSYEVRNVRHQTIAAVETGMKNLSAMDGAELKRSLTPLVDAYSQWIDQQRAIPLPRDALQQTRDELMLKADSIRDRIQEGITLLASDADIREAFKLANIAMHAAAKQADKWREDKRYDNDHQPAWRPFQLAFILLNLASVADPTHTDRRMADLIYFPTGGGKTEAYLGLIAFTLILRRLRGKQRPDEGRGVAVVLRYTLRLLTLDQLGRAATLICALELLRQRDPKRLGNTRFAVGLWVGQSATANRLSDLHKALHDYTPGQKSSPFPLSSCPWCGGDLAMHNIKLIDDSGKPSKTKYTRAVVYCDNAKADCRFSEKHSQAQGLPVLFVDEQIYQELPDFIVATVDKFAMLPWRGEAGMLFGRVSHIDQQRAYGVMHQPPTAATALAEGLYPPELIVQDEMHLISGPLGTLVGLYEVAIDYLCQRQIDGVERVPKVVCSTATVRRAREQIRALFERSMEIFPARGVNDGDNFFASVDAAKPGRLYVGVAAPGRALRTVSVRSYATLLAAAQKHFDPKGAPEQAADPYMTLVGYFNSLRELGGMRRLVEDEVKTRVSHFADEKRPHHLIGDHPWGANRKLLMPAELTSRETTERVKETKQRLAVRRAHNTPKDSAGPLDTVLASNMISVGLDVDRLGLMVVTGQPKTTSEYIQATSRVGRSYPGLVVVCLNAIRPRDRSHYERFIAYHESFYREVEATSVTPFSLQTLDRAMVGTLLAMLRHGIGELQPARGIMQLQQNRPLAETILEVFVSRGSKHREWHDQDAQLRMENELRARGKRFLDAWERVIDRAVDGAAQRTYSGLDRSKNLGKPVMYMATDDPPDNMDERSFAAPTSMRDVEAETHLWLRFKPLDEGR